MAETRSEIVCTDGMRSEAAFIEATLLNAQGDKEGTIAKLEESLQWDPTNQNTINALAKLRGA